MKTIWIARDVYGVSLHKTEPRLSRDAELDHDSWESDDSSVASPEDDDWIAEAFGDLPVNTCAEVRLVLADKPLPLFEARRTPSTGLPPTCEAAAVLRIDPIGSVAAPHTVVTEDDGDPD